MFLLVMFINYFLENIHKKYLKKFFQNNDKRKKTIEQKSLKYILVRKSEEMPKIKKTFKN